MNKFELGQEARDIITGFKGTITARVQYLTGCDQYVLQPPMGKDGKIPEREQIDENRLELIGEKVVLEEGTIIDANKKKKVIKKTGGYQPKVNMR